MPKGVRVVNNKVVKGKDGNSKNKPKKQPPQDINEVDARKEMARLGFNPIEELVKRYRDTSLSERTHQSCLTQLVARYAPTLKNLAVEQSAPPQEDKGVEINIFAPPQQSLGHTIDIDVMDAAMQHLEHTQTIPQDYNGVMLGRVHAGNEDDE